MDPTRCVPARADPAIATATIWQHPADDHGVAVGYPPRSSFTRRSVQRPASSVVYGEGYLAKVARLTAARDHAQQRVLGEYLLLPPGEDYLS